MLASNFSAYLLALSLFENAAMLPPIGLFIVSPLMKKLFSAINKLLSAKKFET